MGGAGAALRACVRACVLFPCRASPSFPCATAGWPPAARTVSFSQRHRRCVATGRALHSRCGACMSCRQLRRRARRHGSAACRAGMQTCCSPSAARHAWPSPSSSAPSPLTPGPPQKAIHPPHTPPTRLPRPAPSPRFPRLVLLLCALFPTTPAAPNRYTCDDPAWNFMREIPYGNSWHGGPWHGTPGLDTGTYEGGTHF